jgi:hypothetical protein
LAKERRFRLATEDIILERARDYAPKPGDRDYRRRNDVPWIDRFAAAGGYAIISGDVRMRDRPHEMLALYSHGFVVIFFERSTGGWNFFHKSSLLLHWWEEVVQKIRVGERGTFWAIPASWPLKDKQLRNTSLALAQMLKDKNRSTERSRRPSSVTPTAPRITERNDPRQTGFEDVLEKKTDGSET